MLRAAALLLAFLAGLAANAALPGNAPAQGVEANEVRDVISQQIDAFRRDDGPAAYGLAAPEIQAAFPEADAFMAMVRRGYPQVYRPRSFVFGTFRAEGDKVLQELRLVGPDGSDYAALYTLTRQADGSLRITGCFVRAVEGSAI